MTCRMLVLLIDNFAALMTRDSLSPEEISARIISCRDNKVLTRSFSYISMEITISQYLCQFAVILIPHQPVPIGQSKFHAASWMSPNNFEQWRIPVNRLFSSSEMYATVYLCTVQTVYNSLSQLLFSLAYRILFSEIPILLVCQHSFFF